MFQRRTARARTLSIAASTCLRDFGVSRPPGPPAASMRAVTSSSVGGWTGVSKMLSPASVTRKEAPGLSPRLLRILSGKTIAPFAETFTVVVMSTV